MIAGKIFHKIRVRNFLALLLLGLVGWRVNLAYQNQRLKLAIHEGSVRMARSALSWGANVNHPDSPIALAGRKYLHHATIRSPSEAGRLWGYSELIPLLLDADANMNLPDRRGFMILDYMVQTGFPEKVKELVERGADVNSLQKTAYNGPHPLILAVKARENAPPGSLYRYDQVVEYLLEKDVDVNAVDGTGQTALYYLSGQRLVFSHPHLVMKFIEKGARVNPGDHRERPPLGLAVTRGQVAIVRTLLDQGAEVDYPTPEGYTPAYLAAYNPFASESDLLTILQILIEAGANLDLEIGGRPPIRETPLARRALAIADVKAEERQ